MMKIYYSEVVYQSWSFYVAASDKGLIYVGSSPKRLEEIKSWVNHLEIVTELIKNDEKLAIYAEQFIEYLAGERKVFTFPVELIGTPFQIEVWKILLTIPYGETMTYSEVAAALNKSSAYSRAVGTAVGKNPLQIVYPCHRVNPKTGAPRGFRGGLQMKMDLLRLEGIE